jgi:hypothetical protein
MSVEHFDSQRPFGSESPLHRFRCAACSYGASCAAAPERCPMCGGSTWEFEGWRPFSSLTTDLSPSGSVTPTE